MARPRKYDGAVYNRKGTNIWWMRYRDRDGTPRRESTQTEDWEEAQKRLRDRLQERDQNILSIIRRGQTLAFGDWADLFLENFSKPPIRAPKTHEANLRAVKHLRPVFGTQALPNINAEEIECYLRDRLRQRVRISTSSGFVEHGLVKPATVHQEFRILQRMFNVAVRKKFLAANPCSGVEFPVRVKGLFRPHYMSWTQQGRIEAQAPRYLRNVIRVISETGLRVYKELASMKKSQVDLDNAVVWIPDSKTANGVAEVPLTDFAVEAFRDQLEMAGPGEWLFPSEGNPRGYQGSFKNAWRGTLSRAGVEYFRIYDLRSTFATRLSAGGVADEWVTQLLRQGDAKVFKKYSQMKLQMKREALLSLDRQASEKRTGSSTEKRSRLSTKKAS
jgi:integrase